MKKLSPQKQQIYDLHKDNQWHCSTEIEFIRDQRKRISEMQAIGIKFESKPCDGICGKNHSSGVFMRRLTQAPTKTIFKVEEINGKYYKRPIEVALF